MPNERFSEDNASGETQPRDAARTAELAAHTRFGAALLVLAIASACLLALATALGDTPGAGGGAHPSIPNMQHGGPSADRGGLLLVVGGLFGAAQILFFGVCFALGMRRPDGLGSVRTPLLVGLVLYLGVWLAVVVSYASYAAAPLAATLWAGLPVPTAILLFGFWPFPVYFVVLYLVYFEENVLSDRTLDAFRRRVEELRASGEGLR